MAAPEPEPSEPSFDAILARLREAVDRLESGSLSLEQSLTLYEEGVALARRGQSLLDRAEKRVELLVAAGDKVEAVPFPSSNGDDGDGESDEGRGR